MYMMHKVYFNKPSILIQNCNIKTILEMDHRIEMDNWCGGEQYYRLGYRLGDMSFIPTDDLVDIVGQFNKIISERGVPVVSTPLYINGKAVKKIIYGGQEYNLSMWDDHATSKRFLVTARSSGKTLMSAEQFIKDNYGLAKKVVESDPEEKDIWVNEKKKLVSTKLDDGKIIKVKCDDRDEFDPYVGVALAYCYKKFGSKSKFKKYVEKKLVKESKKGKKKANDK